MSARGVRIVVGEGPSTRTGLLRFVLDGEGYDVVAEATTTAELARLMATHRPDIVVLDDGIGATAVGMINEMSPNTKVVLVWPGAVMPVGGAARVEPSRVLQDLGPAIARLTGQPGAAAAGRGAAMLDRVTNDPDKLHELLLGGRHAIEGPIIEDREPAPVVILPLTPTVDHSELILNVPDAESDDDRTGVSGAAAGTAGLAAGAAALAGSTPAAATGGAEGAPAATSLAARRGAMGAQSALNRRLGNLALGGAAVASALVLALALGGARVPIAGVSGAALPPSTPPPVTTSPAPPPNGDPGPGAEDTTPPGGESTPGDATLAEPFQNIRLVGNEIPEPPGPPDVDIDPGDIGPGGGNDDPPSGGDGDDGSDEHSGRDSGDRDRGGGNDDPDNGGSGGGDDDGSDDHDSGGGNDGDGDDHDSGGGNDGDGDDHDNGGGNDDEDNPSHEDGNDSPGGGGGPEDPGSDSSEGAGSDRGESGETGPSEGH